MKARIANLVCAAILLSVLVLPGAPLLAATKEKEAPVPVLSATDTKALKAHLGRNVTVEGIVLTAAPGTKDGMRFLNFSESKTTGFVAAIVPAVYPKLRPLENYTGKLVRVTGPLETYKKKPQIKVTRISQIKMLPAPKPDARKRS